MRKFGPVTFKLILWENDVDQLTSKRNASKTRFPKGKKGSLRTYYGHTVYGGGKWFKLWLGSTFGLMTLNYLWGLIASSQRRRWKEGDPRKRINHFFSVENWRIFSSWPWFSTYVMFLQFEGQCLDFFLCQPRLINRTSKLWISIWTLVAAYGVPGNWYTVHCVQISGQLKLVLLKISEKTEFSVWCVFVLSVPINLSLSRSRIRK